MFAKWEPVVAKKAKRKVASNSRAVIKLFTFVSFALTIFVATFGVIYIAKHTDLSHVHFAAEIKLATHFRYLAGNETEVPHDDHATDDHATDDHGTDDAHAFSLFGGISGLGIYIGTVSVIIIVFAVQLVEYFFHLLHTFTHDTPFHRMVQSIEKELMVVGFTAFMFKILVDTTHFLDLNWFHALEYADILVPIFSFSYCGLGLMLILNSVRISNLWSQAYHLTLIEMLNGYYNLNGFVGYFPYGLLLAPFNPTIARMEFRIFQSIFCQTYKIQKAAFAFNEYVEKVFEKFILAMIEIRPTDWLMLCVLVLLNWARNKLHLDYRKCAIHHDQLCEEENARMMFTVAGAIIFGLTALLAVESRRLEVRIMAQKNIRSIHTYPSYLRYMEESAEAKAMDAFRLNKDELKTSAEGVKYSSTHADPEDDDDDDDEEHPPVGMLSRMRSAFIPGGGEGGGHDSHGGGRSSIRNKPNVSNKFSASVKQAWKTKKIVSKMRRRSVTQPVGQSRLAARRTSVMGLGLPGLGFGGGHHGGGGGKSWAAGGGDAGTVDSEQDDIDGSARLRQFLMSRAPPNKAKVAVIAEEDEHEENSSSSSSSSASSDSDASEEFDVNAERHQSVEDEETAGLQKEGVEAEENKVADNAHITTATAIPDAPVVLSPRSRPSVSTQRWKAAPLEHIEPHGFFHVFSKAQRAVDANKRTGTSVHPAYSVHNSAHATAGGSSSSAARYAEAYREDSKVSWGDSPVRVKQQLPPLGQRDPTTSSNKQSSSDDAFTPAGLTATAGDIEMGLGSVRAKLPPISAKPESSSSSSSAGVIPVPGAPSPSSAAVASATGATKVILSPSRTIGKSLPRPHHATSSPSQSHEKSLDKDKEKEDNGNVKHSHHFHHAHSKNTDAASKAATPSLTLAGDSSGKQTTKSPMQAPSPVPSQTNKTSNHSPSAPQQGRGSNITVTNAEEEEESVPIVDVFFLSWPELYIESVQSLIMILALYYSLYFTNFIAAAGSVEWCFITLAPAVLSSLLLVYIIKCAVMLSAIHAVDCDAILEVLEQTEGARALSALMREKVMALLNEMGDDPEVELYNLFAEVDSDHSGAISRDEFAEYMNSIEIHFDRRRWMQVFRGIDTTFDNKITFEEFFVFMFPSTSHGKELQQKKERALQESLTKRSEQRLAELSHYSRSSNRFSYTSPTAAPQPTGAAGNNGHPTAGAPSTQARR